MADGGTVEFSITTLSGETVAAPTLLLPQTVLALKKAICEERPSANPHWQRLLVQGRMLGDAEDLEQFRSQDPVQVQMVVVMDPWDLLQEVEVATQAARCLDALGTDKVAPHLARLFEDPAGNPLSPKAVEDMLFELARRLLFSRTKALPLPFLRTALVPHALLMLESEGLPENRRQCRISFIFQFLGSVSVPRLVAWLRLQPRPLREDLRWRVEQLRGRDDSAPVRLAAKVALSDRGVLSKARIQELVAVHHALKLDIGEAVGIERSTLEALLVQAGTTLRGLEALAAEPHVKYALSKALKQVGFVM